MKLTAIINLLLFFLFSSVSAAESKRDEINRLLKSIDVSDSYYKNLKYGSTKANLFKKSNGSKILAYQSRFGGDGDHTENILQLFEFKNKKPIKLMYQNIDSVKFIESNGILKYITGRYVETLCTVCDGWEVSAQKDIFFVPIKINIETLKVEAELTKMQKESLRSRFEVQSKKNITEQLSYGREEYPKDIDAVKKRLFNVLK